MRSSFGEMSDTVRKSRIFILFSLIIGAAGAMGQSYLLFHRLVNTLPYKEMGSGMYQSIAYIGVWVAPIAAVAIGFVFGRYRFWLMAVVPVVICPLLFAAVFKAISITHESSVGFVPAAEFGDFAPLMAARGFYFHAFSLAVIGISIGAVCGFVLSMLSEKIGMSREDS